jgi:hypothetical protein
MPRKNRSKKSRTTNKARKQVRNVEEPRRPNYTAQQEVVDYLTEDEVIGDQLYCCVSFAEVTDTMLSDVITDVANRTNQNREITREIVETYRNLERPKRAVKVRGNYRSYERATKRAENLRHADDSFHVFIGEVGKWLPFNPDAALIEDENFMEKQLNDLMKAQKLEQARTKMHFEKEMRRKMEQAIIDGTPEGQEMYNQKEEPVQAVEHRVSEANRLIEEFQAKIKALELKRSRAEDKLVFMREQMKEGKEYPEPEQKGDNENTIEINQQSEILEEAQRILAEDDAANQNEGKTEERRQHDQEMIRKLRQMEDSRQIPEDFKEAFSKYQEQDRNPEMISQLASNMGQAQHRDQTDLIKQLNSAPENEDRMFGEGVLIPAKRRAEEENNQ